MSDILATDAAEIIRAQDNIIAINANAYYRDSKLDLLPQELWVTLGNGESDIKLLSQQSIYFDIVSSLHDSPTPDPHSWAKYAAERIEREAAEIVRNRIWLQTWKPGMIATTKLDPDKAYAVYRNALDAIRKALVDWTPVIERTIRQHYQEYDTLYPETETETETETATETE